MIDFEAMSRKHSIQHALEESMPPELYSYTKLGGRVLFRIRIRWRQPENHNKVVIQVLDADSSMWFDFAAWNVSPSISAYKVREACKQLGWQFDGIDLCLDDANETL